MDAVREKLKTLGASQFAQNLPNESGVKLILAPLDAALTEFTQPLTRDIILNHLSKIYTEVDPSVPSINDRTLRLDVATLAKLQPLRKYLVGDVVIVTITNLLYYPDQINLTYTDYDAIVAASGSYTELLIFGINAEELVERAKVYVHEHKLYWNVRKPYAWTDYNSGPHITLSPDMRKYLNSRFRVRVYWQPYHFVDNHTRWVVLPAEIHSELTCKHACHVSIGQERMSSPSLHHHNH